MFEKNTALWVIMFILVGMFFGLIGGCVIEDYQLGENVKKGYKVFFQTNINYLPNGNIETNYQLRQVLPDK